MVVAGRLGWSLTVFMRFERTFNSNLIPIVQAQLSESQLAAQRYQVITDPSRLPFSADQ